MADLLTLVIPSPVFIRPIKFSLIIGFLWLSLGYTTLNAATQLVLWTFGPNSTGYTTAPQSGVLSDSAILTLADGEIDENGKDGTPYTDFMGTEHDAGQGGAWQDVKVNGPDAELLIQFSTLGYEKLALRFDYRSEGPVSYDLAYSFNQTDWTQILDNQPLVVNWDLGTFDMIEVDLSSATAIDNASNLTLRIDDLEEGSGNRRFVFDNLEITGTSIPEPRQVTFMVIGGLAFFVRQRRS